jgi:hypothetical protein
MPLLFEHRSLAPGLEREDDSRDRFETSLSKIGNHMLFSARADIASAFDVSIAGSEAHIEDLVGPRVDQIVDVKAASRRWFARHFGPVPLMLLK